MLTPLFRFLASWTAEVRTPNQPDRPHRIGGFAAENGARAASPMGDCSEGIETSGGSGSCEAHHVGISPQEDRSGAAGTVGEGEGG
jgi:hypothetical protein